MSDELDLLFGDISDGKKYFQELQNDIDPNNEQISSHSMHEKSILANIKQKLQGNKEDFISNINYDNALPDELATQESVPITDVTEGIHDADNTNNEELISTHNSERAIADKPLASQDEISVISTHNSSKFVDESFN
jgi:hypothetical protein